MKLFLYNLFLIVLIPFFSIRILFKSFYDKDYRFNFLQRFGLADDSFTFLSSKKTIWFHAVSLGEVIGSQETVKSLSYDANIILTVTTPTGMRKAQEFYKNTNIKISFAPWDFYLFVLVFIKKINPDLIIIFETEIWPSMIGIASKNKIPVILSNGRISKKSYQAYSKMSFIIRASFNKLTLVLAQSASHEKRYNDLGVPRNVIKVCGSVKFDINSLDSFHHPEIQSFINNKFILAASTHEGEDEIVLDSFIEVQKSIPDLRLVIVPRHPERALSIQKLAKNKSFSTSIESRDINIDSQILIIDSIGKISLLYKSAQAAFVGGSLVDRGGHNIIEPASLGCPIIIGPYVFNFESIAKEFIDTKSCRVVNDYKNLANEFIDTVTDKEKTTHMINAATQVIANNIGASKRQLSAIIEVLNGDKK